MGSYFGNAGCIAIGSKYLGSHAIGMVNLLRFVVAGSCSGSGYQNMDYNFAAGCRGNRGSVAGSGEWSKEGFAS